MKARLTKQKKAILDHLKSVKTHPTAEKVHKEITKTMPEISLGTVYRNLQLLSNSGEILRLEVNGEYRFDAEINPHQHGICTSCGKVMDFFNKEIEKVIIKKANFPEFTPKNAIVYFTGTCASCNKKIKGAKK